MSETEVGRTREEVLCLTGDGEWERVRAGKSLGAGCARVLSLPMGETREEAGGRGWCAKGGGVGGEVWGCEAVWGGLNAGGEERVGELITLGGGGVRRGR